MIRQRYCRHCGRPFLARTTQNNYCCPAHYAMAWRAVKLLEGTHRYFGKNFKRILERAA